MLFSSCPLVLPPQHYSFSFQKIIPFSPSSKTTYAPLEEESTQRARGAALGTRGPRGRKGSETDDMSFLRRAVAKGARHAAMRVQKTTTTTTAHIGTTTTTSSKTTTRRRLFTSASSSPSSSFAPRTHGAKRMAENVMVHKRSFRSGDGNPSSSFKTGMSSSGYVWNALTKMQKTILARTTGTATPTSYRTFSSSSLAVTTRRSSLIPKLRQQRTLVRRRRQYSTETIHQNPLVLGGPRAVKQVTYWLVGGCAWVFSMVVIGGMTRLTRSGLSMTDWKFQYEHPPLTLEDWEREFDKYKQSPEYQKTNIGMTLEEYKFIYWMEYGHRMWGRVLGIYFAAPLAYFSYKGYMTSKLMKRLGVFFVLGATQGMIGWWMVKSGLKQTEEQKFEVPRVSPYRLAAHLAGAFTIYTGMVWTTLNVMNPVSPAQLPTAAESLISATKKLRKAAHPLAGLIGLTAISGAYVAGMDAGRAYNTFPLMNGKIVPDEYLKDWESKGWRNFFENTAAVQFNHRVLALTTLVSVSAVHAMFRGNSALSSQSKFYINALMGITVAQVGLGITALLYHVPVELGSAHQANALLLFTVILNLMHSARKPKKLVFVKDLWAHKPA